MVFRASLTVFQHTKVETKIQSQFSSLVGIYACQKVSAKVIMLSSDSSVAKPGLWHSEVSASYRNAERTWGSQVWGPVPETGKLALGGLRATGRINQPVTRCVTIQKGGPLPSFPQETWGFVLSTTCPPRPGNAVCGCRGSTMGSGEGLVLHARTVTWHHGMPAVKRPAINPHSTEVCGYRSSW